MVIIPPPDCRLEWRWGSGFRLGFEPGCSSKEIVFGVVCPSCFPNDQRNNQSLPKSELESGRRPQNYWKLVIYCQLAEAAQITTQLTEFVPLDKIPAALTNSYRYDTGAR